MTRLVLVAALDRSRAIGRDNALPWHLPADLKRFKALTLGHPILMGRKTAESIGRALPGRRNLVLTRAKSGPYEAQEAVDSIDTAIERVGNAEALMVIGGGEVYALALPLAETLELTEVDTVVEKASAFFPAFDERDWVETFRESHAADERHAFDFVFRTLRRR
jgi:dihydrofolate reductase